MLKEKQELGQAIKEALTQNGYTQADAARKFGVTKPSVNGWIATGRITKANFDELRRWLHKTPPSHWGIGSEHPTYHNLSDLEFELLEVFRELKPERKQIEVLIYAKTELNSMKKSNPLTSRIPKKKATGSK